MIFIFKKQKPKLRDWNILTLYLLDNVMEFENYFERQKQFNHTKWIDKGFGRLSAFSHDGLEEFKKKFFNLYLK